MRSTWGIKRLIVFCCSLACLSLLPETQAGGTIRLLVVTGSHPFDPFFYSLFEGYPDIKWDKKDQTDKPCAAFGEHFADPYDVVLLYDFEHSITKDQKANLMNAFGKGRGLVCLHHAMCSHEDWPEFHELIAGGFYFKPPAGKPISDFTGGVQYRIQIADPKHPATVGIVPFEVNDETYNHFDVSKDAVPLLTAEHEKSGPVIAWTRNFRESRVITIQPGHGPTIFADPSYRKFIVQSIRWVAEGNKAPRPR